MESWVGPGNEASLAYSLLIVYCHVETTWELHTLTVFLLMLTLQTVCTWIQLCGDTRSLTRCLLWTRVHLLSPSSLEVKSIRRQAKITSTDRSVTDEDHVCQTCGGPPGARTVTYIWRSRGRDCNIATKYHRVMSPPRRYVTITKLHCAQQL